MEDKEFEALKRNFVETKTDHWMSKCDKYYAFVSVVLDGECGAFGYIIEETGKIPKVLASYTHDTTEDVMLMIKDYIENILKIEFEY